jgi:hypothetical protein
MVGASAAKAGAPRATAETTAAAMKSLFMVPPVIDAFCARRLTSRTADWTLPAVDG